MSCHQRFALALSAFVVTAAISLDAADSSAKKAFVRGWEGRTLMVKWPVPLSSDFTEASVIDDLLARFVSRQ